MGQVKEYALHSWIRLENRRNEAAIAPANIYNFADRREVIAGHNRGIDHRAETGHRLVEDFAIFRMLGTVLPDVHTEEMVEGNLARLDTMQDFPPGRVMIFPEFGDGK